MRKESRMEVLVLSIKREFGVSEGWFGFRTESGVGVQEAKVSGIPREI